MAEQHAGEELVGPGDGGEHPRAVGPGRRVRSRDRYRQPPEPDRDQRKRGHAGGQQGQQDGGGTGRGLPVREQGAEYPEAAGGDPGHADAQPVPHADRTEHSGEQQRGRPGEQSRRPTQQQVAAGQGVGQRVSGQRRTDDPFPVSAGGPDSGEHEQAGHAERDAPGGCTGRRPEQLDQGEEQREPGDDQPGHPGRGTIPGPAVPACSGRDRIDDIVVLQFRPAGPGGDEMEDVSIPYPLLGQPAPHGQRAAVRPPQRPPTVRLPGVGQALARVPQEFGKQLSQRQVLGQRHVEPPLRGADGHACESGRRGHGNCLSHRPAAPPRYPQGDRRSLRRLSTGGARAGTQPLACARGGERWQLWWCGVDPARPRRRSRRASWSSLLRPRSPGPSGRGGASS